jgi:hypothetical protein
MAGTSPAMTMVDSIFKQPKNLKYDSAFPRRDAPELLRQRPSKEEGAGNAGRSARPQPRAQV